MAIQSSHSMHARWTVKSLLISAYSGIFVVTLSLYGFFGLRLVDSHVKSEKRLLLQKIEATVSSNQNELLNEIALMDHESIQKHLDAIRQDLNVDFVALQLEGRSYTASDPSHLGLAIQNRLAELLLSTRGGEFKTNLSNDFGSINAHLEVGFAQLIDHQIIQPSLEQFFLSLFFTLGVEVLLFALLYSLLFKLLIQPLGRVSSLLKGGALSTDDLLLTASLEAWTLAEISNLLTALSDYQKLRRKADLADLANQVSHDIRSPLTALEMLLPTLATVPENTRVAVRRALTRIRDIANTLLSPTFSGAVDRGKASEVSTKINSQTETVLLSSALAAALSEKRVEYQDVKDVQIECRDCESLQGVYVRLEPQVLSTILSNVVNNAVEAVAGYGSIHVHSRADHAFVTMEISDNGSGIPAHILPGLNLNPTTYNKTHGKGLGLKHAKKQLESWGGSLSITSNVGEWTKVSITIPRASPPAWHVKEINLSGVRHIIILDDDPSIHDVWETRFSQVLMGHSEVRISHAHSQEDLLALLPGGRSSSGCLYLIDYELQMNGPTGIDLIASLNLTEQSLLVTSRWNEKSVQKQAEALGLGILPKDQANRIPIIAPNSFLVPDCILIDDDTTVGDWWNALGEPLGKSVHAFRTPAEFLAVAGRYPPGLTVYLDSNLADGVRGEGCAEALAKAGFGEVYLATGFSKESFGVLPFISGVRGKECPWKTW